MTLDVVFLKHDDHMLWTHSVGDSTVLFFFCPVYKKKHTQIKKMSNRLYCGNKDPLPLGYSGYDTRLNCLRKGVGIGLYRVANNNNNTGQRRSTAITVAPLPSVTTTTTMVTSTPWWVWLIIGLVFFILVIFILCLIFSKKT